MSELLIPESVHATLDALVAFLDQVAASGGPDAPLAVRAATNMRATQDAMKGVADAGGAAAARDRLQYDIGGKGIHDWAWSPAVERELSRYTEGVSRALHAPGRAASG